jgi:N-acetylmuramoyl-L-alanine amidase
VNDRRFLGLLALAILAIPVFLAAQMQRPDAAPPATAAVLDGRELPLPVTINPAGPMFGLTALVNGLGGDLSPGETAESLSLMLEGKEVVIGIGSAIITVGDAIVSLSQPVTRGEGGSLMVPLDFLRKTFGDVLGYSFDWRPEAQRLLITRRQARELPVLLDVVHLQGMTTVVLQFNEAPRYQIKRRTDLLEVQMMGDRLAPPPAQAVQDPFVQSVTIAPELVRIQLAPGLEVASYTLENPFRIVFDVHAPSSAATPAPVAPGLPVEGPPGIHTIVVDPGHGGSETGAIGPSGVAEKDLTLLLARDLEAHLARLGVRVVLTRTEDATLPLDTRPAIANQNKADLFISIHLNSSLGSGARGAETYFLSTEASDARAAKAAATENAPGAAVPPGGAAGDTTEEVKDLELILWDLAQTRHLSESQRFANLIQGELNEALQLRDRGVKQAPFRVLNGAEMPAVLVELGFLSNPDEEKKLQDVAYRGELAEALTRAVSRYKDLVENRPAPQAAPAQPAAPQTTPSPQTPQAPAAAAPTPAKPPGQSRP